MAVKNTAGSSPVHRRISRRTAGSPPDHARGSSRVRTGQLLPGIDGRSAWTRRCRDVIAAHIADLGGVDNCSAAERSIVRRAATLTVELDRMEALFAMAGEASPADLESYQRAANTLKRLLQTVGLQRRAKHVLTLREKLELDQEALDAAEDQEIT
jgi:hypothetical protein